MAFVYREACPAIAGLFSFRQRELKMNDLARRPERTDSFSLKAMSSPAALPRVIFNCRLAVQTAFSWVPGELKFRLVICLHPHPGLLFCLNPQDMAAFLLFLPGARERRQEGGGGGVRIFAGAGGTGFPAFFAVVSGGFSQAPLPFLDGRGFRRGQRSLFRFKSGGRRRRRRGQGG